MASECIDELLSILYNGSKQWEEQQDINRRPAHLRPFYYRILLTSRPFGLALCKSFDEKYLCVVLPESPSGQLGLRSGSEILSINSFTQKSELISKLHSLYPEQKDHQYIWMHNFPKVQYLQDNAVMPITLYLKYDPMLILSENCERGSKDNSKDDSKDDSNVSTGENCKYWKSLQDDIYRWAVDGQPEYWRTVKDCDLLSIPPIQSAHLEQNIASYFSGPKKRSDVFREIAQKGSTDLRPLSSFVVEDEEFKKIGSVSKGERLAVFAKAGAFLEVREPVAGWIQFKKVTGGRTVDYAVKCENVDSPQSTHLDSKLKPFKLTMERQYAEELKLDDVDPASDDAEYNVMDVVGSQNGKMCLFYFLGDIDFGHCLEMQQRHLERLSRLQSKFKDVMVMVVRVCCVTNDLSAENVKNPPEICRKKGMPYARCSMDVLRLYGLMHFDTGFFKYGLMLLDRERKVLVHPAESMDAPNDDKDTLGIFEKVGSHIIAASASIFEKVDLTDL